MQTLYFVYNKPPDKIDKTCGYCSGHDTTKGRCRDPYDDYVYTSNEYVPGYYERHEVNHCSFLSLFNRLGIDTKTTTVDDIEETDKKGVYVVGLRYDLIGEKIFEVLLSKILRPQIINLINKDKLLLVFYDATSLVSGIRGYEHYIIKLEQFIKLNKININNTLVVTNSNFYKTDLTTVKWDVQETSVSLFLYETKTDINLEKKFINLLTDKSARFLLFNSKNRFHRFVLTFKLFNQLKSFKKHFWFSLKKINFSYLIKLLKQPGSVEFLHTYNSINKLLPFNSLLKSLPSFIEIEQPYPKSNLFRFVNKEVYERTGIFIVTETSISNPPTGQIPMLTEKIYKAIAFKMPFILYGEPGSLEHLKSLGYKTFSNFWDESYDLIVDPDERADAIADIIKNIAELNDSDFYNLILSTRKIIEHNYNNLNKLNSEKQFVSTIINKMIK